MIHFLERKMEKEVFLLLSKTFLFKGLSPSELDTALGSLTAPIESFAKGDLVFSPLDDKKRIGFVLEGECSVLRTRGERDGVIINTLGRGAPFGILSVFKEGGEPLTEVYAARASEIIFIGKEDLISLTETSSAVAMNIIKFLADRVSFLNERITAFSGGSAEQKLASHLLSLMHHGDGFEFPLNKKKTAEALGCGRASLYRALATLEAEGAIKTDDKKIYITDPMGLERISK